MTTAMLRGALAALCAVLTSGTAAAQALSTAERAGLDSVMAPYRSQSAPGCAVAATRGRQMVYETGAGMANLEFAQPINAETRFPVASVSKQFTAAAVLLLAREGKLSLDDDVRRHVPQLPDFGTRITIRDLLAHTSGLRDHWELLRIGRGAGLRYHVTTGDALDIVTRQRELNHVPGADYMYSATGYTLAGIIIQRVSGQRLRDFMHQRIFAPLSMTRSQLQDVYSQVIPERAISYFRSGSTWHWMMPNHDVAGPTGVVSTVGDLLRWEANFERPVVGDSALLAELQKENRLRNGEPTGYGLGLFLERYRGTPFITHGGDEIGYHAAVGRFPAFGLAVAVLCNSNDADAGAILYGIADVLLARELEPHPASPVARVAVPSTRLATYAGIYADSVGNPLVVTVRGESLVLGAGPGPLLLAQTERRFRRADGRTEYEFRADRSVVAYRPSYPFTVVYTPRAAASLTTATLREYVGRYVSDELGSAYEITLGDSTLAMKTRWGPTQRLQPVYRDYFSAADPVLFTRDARGAVNGLLMQGPRMRNLRFRKAAVIDAPR